jgi:hypothetical protein
MSRNMDMSPQGRGRLLISLSVIAVLAVLAWQTMEPGKYRQVTWLLLGFFAFRIVLTHLRSRYSKDSGLASVDYATSDETDRRALLKSGKKTLHL